MGDVRLVRSPEIKLVVAMARVHNELAAREEASSREKARFILGRQTVDARVGNRDHRFHLPHEGFVVEDDSMRGDADKTRAASFEIEYRFNALPFDERRLDFFELLLLVEDNVGHNTPPG